MRFEVYEDSEGQWRWRLIAGNGRVVADSAEGYARKRNAVRAAQAVRFPARFAEIEVVA